MVLSNTGRKRKANKYFQKMLPILTQRDSRSYFSTIMEKCILLCKFVWPQHFILSDEQDTLPLQIATVTWFVHTKFSSKDICLPERSTQGEAKKPQEWNDAANNSMFNYFDPLQLKKNCIHILLLDLKSKSNFLKWLFSFPTDEKEIAAFPKWKHANPLLKHFTQFNIISLQCVVSP